MLLTITTTRPPATDLGFLLHKHPDRVQRFTLPFGAAHVVYPEASPERWIIYGPEYADASQIDRLRGRGLGRKRSLAVRERARRRGARALRPPRAAVPRARVVFAVLALESDPVDPRL